MPYPHRDAASNGGSTVTVGVASTALVAANQGRLTLMISNAGAATAYLQFQTNPAVAPTAILASSFPLAAGATLTTNDFTGAVAAISAAGGLDVRVVEI